MPGQTPGTFFKYQAMENNTNQNENPVVLPPANKSETIELSGGRKATIREGNGYDAEEAMRVSGTTDAADKAYMSALMAACTMIDDKPVVMEDIRLLRIGDYVQVMTVFSKLNF